MYLLSVLDSYLWRKYLASNPGSGMLSARLWAQAFITVNRVRRWWYWKTA